MKYQHPILNSSKDLAQVKVFFFLRCDADTRVMVIAPGQSSRRAKKDWCNTVAL